MSNLRNCTIYDNFLIYRDIAHPSTIKRNRSSNLLLDQSQITNYSYLKQANKTPNNQTTTSKFSGYQPVAATSNPFINPFTDSRPGKSFRF